MPDGSSIGPGDPSVVEIAGRPLYDDLRTSACGGSVSNEDAASRARAVLSRHSDSYGWPETLAAHTRREL